MVIRFGLGRCAQGMVWVDLCLPVWCPEQLVHKFLRQSASSRASKSTATTPPEA